MIRNTYFIQKEQVKSETEIFQELFARATTGMEPEEANFWRLLLSADENCIQVALVINTALRYSPALVDVLDPDLKSRFGQYYGAYVRNEVDTVVQGFIIRHAVDIIRHDPASKYFYSDPWYLLMSRNGAITEVIETQVWSIY